MPQAKPAIASQRFRVSVQEPSSGQSTKVGRHRYELPLVFAVIAMLASLPLTTQFTLAIDEGIYLSGAERVANGETPFRDFFVFTGPGCFWLYGAVFRLFGATLPNARIVLCLELACLASGVYWLVAGFARRVFAAGTASLFVAVLLTSPYQLYITHRWDSNALALVALVLTWAGTGRANRTLFLLAGAAAAMAAWFTPPLALTGVAIGAWMACLPDLRRHLLAYGAGLAIPSLLAAAILLHQGALGAMVQCLQWAAANYGAANSVPYGSLAGDAQRSFHSVRSAVRFLESALPAVLPVLAYAGWAAMYFRRSGKSLPPGRYLALLLGFSAAALAACYPRFGGAQLWFASAGFWVLCAYLLYAVLPDRWRTHGAVALLLSAILLLILAAPARPTRRLATRAGQLQVSQRHYALIASLQSRIQPGDSLFVYPYLPVLYFLTGGRNPARYSYLQPGMMTAADEAGVLGALQANPPRWIVWHDFPRQLILKNWPNSNPARVSFPALEAFFGAHYHLANPAEAARAGYRLLERNQGPL